MQLIYHVSGTLQSDSEPTSLMYIGRQVLYTTSATWEALLYTIYNIVISQVHFLFPCTREYKLHEVRESALIALFSSVSIIARRVPGHIELKEAMSAHLLSEPHYIVKFILKVSHQIKHFKLLLHLYCFE